jgi:Flp pilus assembly protein TadD
LTERIDPAVEPVLGLVTLTRALREAGEEAVAERLLRMAVTARPQEVVLYHTLGDLLREQDPPRWSEAVECYRVARGLRPDLGLTLAEALRQSGREREGLDLLAWLVKETPDNPFLHFCQGNDLSAKGDLGGAIACFRKALELDPIAPVYINLGLALGNKGDLDGAIACYRKALELDLKDAQAHHNLGNALGDKGDLDGAIACYRKALELDPKDAQSHNNLGIALHDMGDLDGAIACYRKALELDPIAPVYTNLGVSLGAKGDLGGAIACFKKALDRDPKYAKAHDAMGLALLEQGRYAAARESTRRALELLPTDAPLRRMALQQLQQCDHMVALDQKLPGILTGAVTPANASEAVAMAQLCQQPYQKRYATSARLYADAFVAELKIAANLDQQHRYNAACSAALAAAGQGHDARLLPDKVVSLFRRWALGWLRDDLTAYAQLAQQKNPTLRQTIQKRLIHWRRDPDLAAVRDSAALNRLSEQECAAWQALWHDVDELSKRLGKKD